MKARRKEAIDRITKDIKETQNTRRLILTELKKKGASTITELQQTTGIPSGQVLRHLIAMRKAGEVTEVGLKDEGYVYALRRGR